MNIIHLYSSASAREPFREIQACIILKEYGSIFTGLRIKLLRQQRNPEAEL